MPERDRVFLDSNVLLAASIRPGAAIARLWLHPDFDLIVSQYVVTEVRRNLRIAYTPALDKLMESILVIDEFEYPPRALPSGIELHAKDVPVLLAAIGAGATHLLTGDKKHFGKLYRRTIEGVLILPPAEYRRSG